MADFEPEDRTEQATAHRRQELRRRGQVARSGDLTAAVAVLAAAAALNFFGAGLVGTLAEVMRSSLSAPAWQAIEMNALWPRFWDVAQLALRAVGPILALVVLSAVVVNLSQVGFLLTTEPLGPEFERLDPAAGLQRLLTWHGPVTFAASLFKFAAIAAIAVGFLTSQLSKVLEAGTLDTASFAGQIGTWLANLGLQLAIGLVALAVMDYGFQLWKYERDIRMTKQEIRDELRQTEGDPQLRQRRREAHRKSKAAPQSARSDNAASA